MQCKDPEQLPFFKQFNKLGAGIEFATVDYTITRSVAGIINVLKQVQTCYENEIKGFLNGPGKAGVQRKARFDELVTDIEQNQSKLETNEALLKVIQFYEDPQNKSGRLMNIVREALLVFFTIPVAQKFEPSGEIWSAIYKLNFHKKQDNLLEDFINKVKMKVNLDEGVSLKTMTHN